jgi:GntP family gluconate:H+ symporter
MPPLALLGVAIALVIGAIVLLRVNAFLALLGTAIIVSLLSPGLPAEKIGRVAEGFGRTAGSIGIVIALAAIIGKAMTDSGAADRIVRGFLSLLGEKRGATALGSTGFVLSIPVFYDTVFYLLVPLARSMHRRTGGHYLLYLMAIAGGACATHTLVPPTPGPLAVAAALGVDLGVMVLMGLVVAVPAATAGLWFARFTDRRMPIEPPAEFAPEVMTTPRQPGLLPSIAPIVLPVILISANTVATSLKTSGNTQLADWAQTVAPYTTVLGNANLALFFSAIIAMWTYARMTGATRADVAAMSEDALSSAGIIILITAAGGAFGATLQAAQVGPAIQELFPMRDATVGIALLVLAFAISSLIKIAQGSSTVAMITTAGMLGALVQQATLPFHLVYVATAIASGALVGTWMNDSGFWVFSKLGGVPERQTLLTWTPLSATVGITAMIVTVILALVMPMQ